jgi:hypothetical protein
VVIGRRAAPDHAVPAHGYGPRKVDGDAAASRAAATIGTSVLSPSSGIPAGREMSAVEARGVRTARRLQSVARWISERAEPDERASLPSLSPRPSTVEVARALREWLDWSVETQTQARDTYSVLRRNAQEVWMRAECSFSIYGSEIHTVRLDGTGRATFVALPTWATNFTWQPRRRCIRSHLGRFDSAVAGAEKLPIRPPATMSS